MAERKSVVVTGASTGIGYAIAAALGKRGIEVFGSVRTQADGERLQRELGNTFTPLLMDVTDDKAVQAAAVLVAERLGRSTLFGLVNNAGIGAGGPLLHQPMEEFRQTLETNLLGPFRVTQAFAPLLGADRGRVETHRFAQELFDGFQGASSMVSQNNRSRTFSGSRRCSPDGSWVASTTGRLACFACSRAARMSGVMSVCP